MKSFERQIVYLPESVLREPRAFLKLIISELSTSFHIGRSIFYRDFSARYKQTFTGYLGALFPVLITTLSFVMLQKMNVINTSISNVSYGTFVFINTIFWELFTESIMGPSKELQANISAIIRLNFPRESIFIASVFNILANLGIKLLVVLVVLPFLDVEISWNLLWMLPIAAGLMAWGILIGLLILPINVLYSDFRNIVDAFLKLLFFLTPVAYELQASEGIVGKIRNYNFLAQFFDAIKSSAFFGFTPENILTILLFSFLGLLLLGFGWVFYRVSLPILVERMPS